MSRQRAATSPKKVRPLRPSAPVRTASKRAEPRRGAAKRSAPKHSPAVHRAAMLFSLATTLAVGSLVLIAVAPKPLTTHAPAALTASHERDNATSADRISGDRDGDAKLSSAALSADR